MTRIVVDAVEAALIAQSEGGLQVRHPHGKLIGFVTPAPPEDEMERMMARFDEGPDGPFRSADVLERLRALGQPYFIETDSLGSYLVAVPAAILVFVVSKHLAVRVCLMALVDDGFGGIQRCQIRRGPPVDEQLLRLRRAAERDTRAPKLARWAGVWRRPRWSHQHEPSPWRFKRTIR